MSTFWSLCTPTCLLLRSAGICFSIVKDENWVRGVGNQRDRHGGLWRGNRRIHLRNESNENEKDKKVIIQNRQAGLVWILVAWFTVWSNSGDLSWCCHLNPHCLLPVPSSSSSYSEKRLISLNIRDIEGLVLAATNLSVVIILASFMIGLWREWWDGFPWNDKLLDDLWRSFSLKASYTLHFCPCPPSCCHHISLPPCLLTLYLNLNLTENLLICSAGSPAAKLRLPAWKFSVDL